MANTCASSTASDIRDQGLEEEPTVSKPRTLTFLNGLAVVLGLQIGSGVFSAPAVVLTLVQSTPIAILVWLSAGLLVWTGASCFIELGTAIPANGGMQEYLRAAFGDDFGFLFAFAWIIVVKPCSVAMISLIFSEYALRLVEADTEASTWALKVLSLLAVAVITYLNCVSTKAGTRAASGFLVVKIIGLLSIPVLGAIRSFWTQKSPATLGFEDVSGVSITPQNRRSLQIPTWEALGAFVDAIFAALYAYGGWESVSRSWKIGTWLIL